MRDGLLVAEADLNLIRQIKDKWCFQVMTGIPLDIYLLYTVMKSCACIHDSCVPDIVCILHVHT